MTFKVQAYSFASAINALVTAGPYKPKRPLVHPEDEHTLHSVETI